MNDYRLGMQNLSMNVIVMDREELIEMVRDAMVRNYVYLERDILGRASAFWTCAATSTRATVPAFTA